MMTVQAENLLLRRQLALDEERGVKPGVKPRGIDAATRVSLAWWSRWYDWRSCLIVVRPETVIRWHRAGTRHPSLPHSPQQSRHRLREGLVVLARSVLGGLRHEYSLAPAVASSGICAPQVY
jgi:hypothetical protein